MRRLLFATGNRHKAREAADICAASGVTIVTPEEVGYIPNVDETGDTFAANAILKAQAACQATGLWSISDDSGIEATALSGRPGVHSARYAGVHGDDAANNQRLIDELSAHADKRVRYVCVIALARPDLPHLTWDGYFSGLHLSSPRGLGGFGYDPYVLIPELGRTVAELTNAEKHARSHRGTALRAFAAWLATHDNR